MKTVTRKAVGVVLVILGLAALLTPFSPGSWLILIGLEFLGLRILLENKLWQWTGKRPDSKISRAVRRVLCLKPRDASGRLKCEQARKPRA
jgi:protein-S-isoprenylcysteine O-methyltransferase Ste14